MQIIVLFRFINIWTPNAINEIITDLFFLPVKTKFKQMVPKYKKAVIYGAGGHE